MAEESKEPLVDHITNWLQNHKKTVIGGALLGAASLLIGVISFFTSTPGKANEWKGAASGDDRPDAELVTPGEEIAMPPAVQKEVVLPDPESVIESTSQTKQNPEERARELLTSGEGKVQALTGGDEYSQRSYGLFFGRGVLQGANPQDVWRFQFHDNIEVERKDFNRGAKNVWDENLFGEDVTSFDGEFVVNVSLDTYHHLFTYNNDTELSIPQHRGLRDDYHFDLGVEGSVTFLIDNGREIVPETYSFDSIFCADSAAKREKDYPQSKVAQSYARAKIASEQLEHITFAIEHLAKSYEALEEELTVANEISGVVGMSRQGGARRAQRLYGEAIVRAEHVLDGQSLTKHTIPVGDNGANPDIDLYSDVELNEEGRIRYDVPDYTLRDDVLRQQLLARLNALGPSIAQSLQGELEFLQAHSPPLSGVGRRVLQGKQGAVQQR